MTPAQSFATLDRAGGCWRLDPTTNGTAGWQRLLEQWAEHHYLSAAAGADTYTHLVAQCRVDVSGDVPSEQRPLLDRLFTLLDRCRVLTLLREGPWGCVAINRHLQEVVRRRLDPPAAKASAAHGADRASDHERQLFNGDVGVTLRGSGGYQVVFPRRGGYVAWLADTLPEHKPAFAMTIHKAQGGEYAHVLLVLPPSGGRRLLTKELVYTGVTRARELAVLCSTEEALQCAVARKVERESALVRWTATP